MTRAINDPGNEDPGSLLETDADALLGGAAVQAPEERCRLASQDCIRACERYLALCTESSREQRQHAGDCADLCRLAALLLEPVSYTHLRAHETLAKLVCRLMLEKKKWRGIKDVDNSHIRSQRHGSVTPVSSHATLHNAGL
ncbi:hypothetical protein KZ850_33650, partial [Pseudomonas aeruginosa]|nr:hypothetical protein [Pseudomonas aeruginosa]